MNKAAMEPYQTKEKDGAIYTWEWWEPTRLGGLLGSETGVAEDSENMRTLEASIWTKDTVKELFESQAIDTGSFGKGKANSLDQIAKELIMGECTLVEADELPDKQRLGSPRASNKPKKPAGPVLLRIVEVVLLRMRNADTGELLIETSLTMKDGSKREEERLPGTKVRPEENLKATARRVLRDYLRVPWQEVSKFCTFKYESTGGKDAAVGARDTGGADAKVQFERLE